MHVKDSVVVVLPELLVLMEPELFERTSRRALAAAGKLEDNMFV